MSQGQWQAMNSNENWQAMLCKLEGIFTQKHHDTRINFHIFSGCCGQQKFLSFNAFGSSTCILIL